MQLSDLTPGDELGYAASKAMPLNSSWKASTAALRAP
jgi:hypothetical protein